MNSPQSPKSPKFPKSRQYPYSVRYAYVMDPFRWRKDPQYKNKSFHKLYGVFFIPHDHTQPIRGETEHSFSLGWETEWVRLHTLERAQEKVKQYADNLLLAKKAGEDHPHKNGTYVVVCLTKRNQNNIPYGIRPKLKERSETLKTQYKKWNYRNCRFTVEDVNNIEETKRK